MLRKIIHIVSLFLCCAGTIHAQELNCQVEIISTKIVGKDPVVFVAMKKAINEFMNTHKWTTDEFAVAERIDCKFLITLMGTGVNGDPDGYTAMISVQASRPVYNASYFSTIVNFVDKDVAFKFTQFNPIRFDDNQVSGSDPLSGNLTAVLAYYSYLIIALDYDSFSPSGGTVYLKKAQNVVNNAPDTKGISGWKAMENNRNRYWIVDQLLNTRFNPVRTYWYSLHREGLDSMYAKPNEARNRILDGVKNLYQVNRENPSSILLQFFFNAKSDEMMKMLSMVPKAQRQQYITLLSVLDVPNAAKYNALLK